MTASVNVVEKIRTEIRALEHELDRRENQKKQRFQNPLTNRWRARAPCRKAADGCKSSDTFACLKFEIVFRSIIHIPE
jgi:hypothetical protein